MILEHDVGDVNGGTGLATAKVEEQVHALHVDTGHVTLPEDVILACLEVDAVGKVEDVVIAVHNEFHGDTVQILVTVEDAREVIVLGRSG